MEIYLKYLTKEQDAAKNAEEKEDKMFKNVRHAKVKEELFKCIKWDLACINRFKKIVINAKGKVKLQAKGENAKPVMEKKYYKNKKLYKSLLKRVLQITILLK